ncbi:MAG: metallophosphoesterase family protein [Gemmatimonadota bacterium]
MRIGLISDTHGRLRKEVFDRFEGVQGILHAGDVGPYDLIVELEAIAPVTAVYGNTDRFDVRDRLPGVASLELAGRRIVVVHGDQLGSPTPARLRRAHPDADIIVYGHTHRPDVDRDDGSLVVNPGSAGAARFGIPASVGILTLGDAVPPAVELFQLGGPAAAAGQ